MKLFIKPKTQYVKELYKNHSFAYNGDSGMDLYFPNDDVIKAGNTKLIDLEIACELRDFNFSIGSKIKSTNLYKNKSYMLIPRSSIHKTPLRLANSIGLIDSMYRGNLKVAIDNISDEDYTIKKGEKLFQLIIPNLETFDIVLTDVLSESVRDNNGFGSSGK